MFQHLAHAITFEAVMLHPPRQYDALPGFSG
jgi:hypothetical protein